MRTPWMLAALLCACGGGQQAAAPTPTPPAAAAAPKVERYAGPKIRVAVGNFDAAEGPKALMEKMGWLGVGPMITEQIITGLVNTGRVWVLERQQLGKLVGNIELEQGGDMSKYFDQKTTVEKGKFLGAQAILVGTLSQFEPNVGGDNVELGFADIIGLNYHDDKAVVGVEVRLVDQETGKVLHAAHGEAEIKTTEAGLSLGYQGVKLGGGAFERTPLGKATREATKKALAELVKAVKTLPWEGKVLDVKGDKVFVDGGKALNLKAGDRFRIVHRGDAITGPDGSVVGYDDTEGGWVELTNVQDKMSIGKVVEGEAPKKGDLVRLPAQ